MTMTVEHISEIHKLAAERVASGQSKWAFTLYVERRVGGTFEENRDLFAQALRESAWFKAATDDGEDIFGDLYEFWDLISHAENEKDFDMNLEAIYNLADYDRCFIEFTHS